MRRTFLLITFLLCNSYIFAQGKAGLTGFVFDGNNNEVVNTVAVKLSSKDNAFTAIASSDLLGKFEFKNLTGGNYQISLSRIGYQSKIMDFSLD